jgi:hypothetical protein
MSTFVFTPLIEPTSNVTQNPPVAPFNPVMAYLMGQCCSLTYTQYDAGVNWVPDFSSLALSGYTIAASNPQALTLYEANEPGPTTGDVGDYTQLPGGFAVQLTLTPTGGGNAQTITVVALRGTRTFDEWFDDADGIPAPFGSTGELDSGLGSVHAGFYGLYTIGQNGLVITDPLNPQPSSRATGSLAAQVGKYVSALNNSFPLYVTGHSLGGALASLCALDIAYNYPGSFSQIYMYSLASPRVAAGLAVSTLSIPVPTLGNQQAFLSRYQSYVPNSYPIIHAADLIPILPPASTSLGPLTLTFNHVTDPYQLSGSGATATANVSNGAVTSVTVNNQNSNYPLGSWGPVVVFSGGGGSGAAATSSIDLFGNVSVKVTYGGSGYTSAPSVQFVYSGALPQNIVNFCAQTGDLGGNHSCVNTYVPYLQQLAEGF